jgi:hypothetical protein
MTTPQPPETESFIQWGIKERDAAALALRKVHLSYHTLGAILLLMLGTGGIEAWKWHVKKLARLEAQAGIEKTKATNEHKLSDAWRSRAIALTDSVRVDTVVRHLIVRNVKVDTMWVPAASPVPQDGVTYSDPQPLVPIAVVSKLAFDSADAACTRVEHDCAHLKAADDSALAHADSMAESLKRLNHNTEQRLKSVQRVENVKLGVVAAIFYTLGKILH